MPSMFSMQERHSAFQLPSDNQIRMALIALAGFGLAVYLGTRIGDGDTRFIYGLLVLAAGGILMITLGEKFWLISVVTMTANVHVPLTIGRDFTLAEMGIMLLAAHTTLRVALRRQRILIFRKDHLWPLLYFAWAMIVFARNPSGLFTFGGDVVGARYYFDLLLALCIFIILANTRIVPEDIPWIIGLQVFGMSVSLFSGYQEFTSMASIIDFSSADTPFYTWQQGLGALAYCALSWMFARYSFRELASFEKLYLWGLLAICCLLVLLSGKRQGIGLIVAIPLFGAILRRSYLQVWMIGILLALLLGMVVVGHGRFYQLPLVTQRALSILPGKWDPSANLGFDDVYRKILREDAMERISAHPWIGQGFALSVKDIYADQMMTRGQIISGIRAGGSWHNTWFAISADFGIPAAFIWAALWLSFTAISFRLYPQLTHIPWYQVLVGYVFIILGQNWMTSWHGGHSVLSAFHYWWIFGLLVAVRHQVAAGMDASPGKLLGIEKGRTESAQGNLRLA